MRLERELDAENEGGQCQSSATFLKPKASLISQAGGPDSTHPRKDPTGVRATAAMYTGGREDIAQRFRIGSWGRDCQRKGHLVGEGRRMRQKGGRNTVRRMGLGLEWFGRVWLFKYLERRVSLVMKCPQDLRIQWVSAISTPDGPAELGLAGRWLLLAGSLFRWYVENPKFPASNGILSTFSPTWLWVCCG